MPVASCIWVLTTQHAALTRYPFFAAASAEAVCAECMPELDELVMSWQAAKHDV